ncbi:MAG: beta strand repeat-containing protein, partial [Bryobacteraceae bacterium]
STLTASNGGTIQAGALATLLGVAVSVDGVSSLPLPALTSATISQFTVTGAAQSIPNLTDFDGSNAYVAGGGDLSMPALTTFTNLANLNDQYRTLQASGIGSVLDLRNVTTITNGTAHDTNLTIQALAGAAVNLSGLTQITDTSSGDQAYRAINVTADGPESLVNVSSLANITDNYAGTNGDQRFSTITASNGGTIQAAALATLVGVAASLDGTSSLALPALASATISQFTVTGGTETLPKLTDFDGSNAFVSGGGTLALPALTSYTNLANLNDQYRTLQANGAGSVLDLRNVTTITNGAAHDTNLTIQALAGATVNLGGATQIVDPPTGDQTYRAINVTADGEGSTVNLAALTNFTDNYAGTNGDQRFSTITASNGGTIQAAALTTLVGVAASVDGMSGLALPALASVTISQFSVSGGTETLPKLTDFDGSNALVSGGGDLALPALTSYTNFANLNDQYRTLQASDPGSRLDLHNVTTITNGAAHDTNLTLQALAGATVNLAGATQIVDPPTGDQTYRAINVNADGAGSVVSLPALTSFE